MDANHKEVIAKVKQLGAEEAASLLLSEYSLEDDGYGEVFNIINHRSWPKREQIRLADYYLSNIPHSSERAYKVFLGFMSAKAFVNVIKKHVPDSSEKRALLAYHLIPLLDQHMKSGNASSEIKDFVTGLHS